MEPGRAKQARVRAELRVLGAGLNGRVPYEEGVHEWGQLHACRRGFGFSSVAVVADDDHLKRLCRALLHASLCRFHGETRARYAASSFCIFDRKGSPSLSRSSFLCRFACSQICTRVIRAQLRTQRYRKKEISP